MTFRVMYVQRRKFGLSVVAGTLFLLSVVSCVQQSADVVLMNGGRLSDTEVQRLLDSQMLLADANPDALDSARALLAQDPLAVNGEMRRFIHAYVAAESSSNSKLQQLLQALLHGGLLGVSYNPMKTYTAAETFYYQEGNCLSFSMLTAALGREVGLNVRFNEVQVPPTWDMQSARTQVNYRHMNVVVKAGRQRKIVDINMSNYSVDYQQDLVSDDYAVAQYYNNLAMESLINGEPAVSFLLLREALTREPELSFLWGNLGTVYRRAGYYHEAEVAYLKGLQLDGADLMIVSNLARLYRQMDSPDKADYYEQLAASYRARNPYYRYSQAGEAFATRQLDDALDNITAAIEAYSQDSRFYFLAAKINRALGRNGEARRQLQMAMSLTGDDAQRRLYRETLAELTPNNLGELTTIERD
ncbi:tetratricopeptide repeat protein [Pseudomaricurvus sp.]|uniref:tetratricopeptide repeat protein n=1 Tax=Pseudomaricurvus sp. TaxID=2004510 RepID=UPI003F6CA238